MRRVKRCLKVAADGFALKGSELAAQMLDEGTDLFAGASAAVATFQSTGKVACPAKQRQSRPDHAQAGILIPVQGVQDRAAGPRGPCGVALAQQAAHEVYALKNFKGQGLAMQRRPHVRLGFAGRGIKFPSGFSEVAAR